MPPQVKRLLMYFNGGRERRLDLQIWDAAHLALGTFILKFSGGTTPGYAFRDVIKHAFFQKFYFIKIPGIITLFTSLPEGKGYN